MKRLICLACLLLISTLAFGCGGGKKTTLVGLTDAVEVDVASKVPGRVEELYVQEGDRVQAGQKLVTISREQIAAKLDQVNAIVEAATAQFKMAKKGAREEQKRATARQLDAARAQMELAKKMFDRVAALYAKNAIPKAQYDEVEFKYNAATQQYEMARAMNDAVTKGARDEEKEALGALVKQAEGALQEVESYDKETTQNAPIAGEISKVVLHKGELASTGFPIVTILDVSTLWVAFSVREDLLPKVQKGARIVAEVPALNKQAWFEVYHVAAMGDFATWRATQERNSFDLKTFEVRMKPLTPLPELRPGMTVRWTVE